MGNLLTTELIMRGGSKLETTRLILERGIPIPVPRSAWLYSGQRLDGILPQLQAMLRNDGRIIVRGSHPTDYHWSIDAVHTERNVTSIDGAGKALEKIEKGVNSRSFRLHCQDGGVPWSGEAHALIQQQVDCQYLGSMMRHPHLGHLHIECFDAEGRYSNDPFRGVTYVYDTRKSSILPELSDDLKMAIDRIYILFEESGIPETAYAQQVEFSPSGYFFQARPGFLKTPAQDFIFFPGFGIPYIRTDDVFGITLASGIDLDFLTNSGEDMYFRVFPEEEYGFFLTEKFFTSAGIKSRLGGLKTFVSFSGIDNGQYLSHGSYRFMKKAGFSFVGSRLGNVPADLETRSNDFVLYLSEEFARCRFWSNGAVGMIAPAKYFD